MTAEEKGTISAIVGLASRGAPLGSNSGDVGTATQAGQLSQNAVENNLFGVLSKDKSANKAKNNEYFQKLSACTTYKCREKLVIANANDAMSVAPKTVQVQEGLYKTGDIISSPTDGSGLQYKIVEVQGKQQAVLLSLADQAQYMLKTQMTAQNLVRGNSFISPIANTALSGYEASVGQLLLNGESMSTLERVLSGIDAIGSIAMIKGGYCRR